MLKKALLKDTKKEITNNFKRFISILLIVLLGVGFFVGIKAASPDMKMTLDSYFDNQNVFDIEVISTLGLTNSDIEELKKIENIKEIEPTYFADVVIKAKKEQIIKLEAIPTDLNNVILLEGNLPENINECVVENSFLTANDLKIGDSIEIEAEDITNSDGEKEKLLKDKNVKIVGTVQSPLYLSRDRGSTKLGSGKINYYMYVPIQNFNSNLYTALYISVNNAKELKTYENKYEELINDIKDKIEEKSEERKQARFNDIYEEANEKILDAEKTLDEETKEANSKISEAEEELEKAKTEIENGKKELAKEKANTQIKLDNAKSSLDEAKQELELNEKLFEEEKTKATKQIDESKKNLESLKNIQKQYEELKKNLEQSNKLLVELQEKLKQLENNNGENTQNIQEQIQELQKNIYILEASIQKIESELTKQGINPSNLNSTIQKMQEGINLAQEQLNQAQKKLEEGKAEIQKNEKLYESNKKQAEDEFAKAQSKLDVAEKQFQNGVKELEASKKELEEETQKAKEEIQDAKAKLNDISKPEWYILDRNQNAGYVSYLQDSDRIDNIAKVFPVVFFVVAALTSLTSMTRMVDEQRTEIGTLKALGYNKLQIASKYIIYASLASIIGGVIGMLIGFPLLPRIIFKLYAMMYNLPSMVVEFNIEYALIGLLVAILCTVGAAIYSCMKSLLIMPATLMRPKAPKPGKRVFLEKIHFIWSHLNFTKKVTARNLFRYKKRFLMTIIGVAGCTALIVAGFGLRDAVSSMIPVQYGEIFNYNLQISLKDNLNKEEIEKAYETIIEKEKIESAIKVNIQSIKIIKNDNNQSIQQIVPQGNLENYITLRSRVNPEKNYTLNNEGIIITEKLAKLLEIKKGDTITIENNDNRRVEVKVEEITENYLLHYVYMTPELYKQLYNEEASPNMMFAITKDISNEDEEVLGKQILEELENYVSSITFTSSTTDIFSEVMNNLSLVVWVLIIAAGLLAFVVLYNLSNANITERIRELATIKVLGFYDKEVFQYIGREIIILTILGILVGLIAGNLLTTFIIKTCELDMLMFNPSIKPLSYIYGAIITCIFAIIVNIGTYFALKKINMIESLKSVE